MRCVRLPDDAELLTRHEVLADPPDVLVTNYSMLEYMMMRPVERPIFDATREWLAKYPDERLLLVIDEAHLYRGASGAEVALLLRRLQERLQIDESRLQVILTSASFGEETNAKAFASDLTGLPVERFEVITGDLYDRPNPGPGSSKDAALLAAIDLDAFYGSDDNARRSAIQPLLDARGTEHRTTLTKRFTRLSKPTRRSACLLTSRCGELSPSKNSAHSSSQMRMRERQSRRSRRSSRWEVLPERSKAPQDCYRAESTCSSVASQACGHA